MNRSPSLLLALYLVNLLAGVRCRWEEEVVLLASLCCCFELRISQAGCALVTMMMMLAGREEMGWMNKSHGRLDKTREGTRQFGWCGVV